MGVWKYIIKWSFFCNIEGSFPAAWLTSRTQWFCLVLYCRSSLFDILEALALDFQQYLKVALIQKCLLEAKYRVIKYVVASYIAWMQTLDFLGVWGKNSPIWVMFSGQLASGTEYVYSIVLYLNNDIQKVYWNSAIHNPFFVI